VKKIVELIRQYGKLPEEPFPIVLFGSSNTAVNFGSRGRLTWGEWIHRALRLQAGMNFKVINSGIGGDTTRDLLNRIRRDVLYYRPKAVILTVGGNDCSRDLGLETYRSNLYRLVEILEDHGILPVLQTYYVPDYSAFHSQVPGKDARVRREFPMYMEAVRQVAAERGLGLIDLYRYFEPLYREDLALYKTLMIDDMHLSYVGNYAVASVVARQLGLGQLPMPEDIAGELSFVLGELDRYNGTGEPSGPASADPTGGADSDASR